MFIALGFLSAGIAIASFVFILLLAAEGNKQWKWFVATLIISIFLFFASAIGYSSHALSPEPTPGKPATLPPTWTPQPTHTPYPTNTPYPTTAPTVTEDMSRETSRYLKNVSALAYGWHDDFMDLNSLLIEYSNNPSVYYVDSWVSDMAIVLTSIQNYNESARSLDAPPGMEEAQEMVNDIAFHLDNMVDHLVAGIDHDNPYQLELAISDINKAKDTIFELVDWVEAHRP